MKELFKKRNELRKASMYLRSAKFDDKIEFNDSKRLIEEQDKIYKKYKFFDNLVKASQIK